MVYYVIKIISGEREDKWGFIYKDLYFEDKAKAETIKSIIDIIIDAHNGIMPMAEFKPLEELDDRFPIGYRVYSVIREVKVNLV